MYFKLAYVLIFVQLLVEIELSGLIIDLGIIFFKQQRQAALILLTLNNKDKAHIHQVICRVTQII